MVSPPEPRPPAPGVLDGARPGDHVCWAYVDDAAYEDALARFAADGFRHHQRVLLFVPIPSVRAVRHRLEATVPGAREAIASGQLELGTFEDAYLPDGRFDADARIAGFEQAALSALADGYEGVRVAGDTTGILSDPEALAAWPAYELRSDLLIARLPIIGVCSFDLRRCDPEPLATILSLHPEAAGAWPRGRGFALHASRSGGLSLAGEIDANSATTIEVAASGAATDVHVPRLDVGALRFIDVAGMRALVAAIRAVGRDGDPVELRGARRTVTKLWELLDCERDLDVEVRFA